MSSTDEQQWDAALDALGFRAIPTATRGGPPQYLPAGTSLVQVTIEETGVVALVPPPPAVERGLAALVARLFASEPVGKYVIRPLIGRLGHTAVETWERHYRPNTARWYRPADARAGAKSLVAPAALTGRRSLLLLHDQFASVDRTFGRLDQRLHAALADRYDGMVWALDHPTLAAVPADNAQAVLDAIGPAPAGELDIVAVGRGGLVATELIRRCPAGLRIGNVITLGTPHLGTPLASAETIVAYANRLANVLSLGPDPVSDIASIAATVIAVAVEHGSAWVPGITAMAPVNSVEPLRGWTGSLTCIGADYEPSDGRIGAAFANWALDSVFEHADNDLIVPSTSSRPGEFGGIAVRTVDPGNVSHGDYLTSPLVAAALRDDLLGGRIVVPSVPTPAPGDELGPAEDSPRLVKIGPDDPDRGRGRGEDAEPRPVKLVVDILHASVEHSDMPIIVGHIQGTPLSGVEEHLDRLLGNELSSLRILGRYAGRVGDVVVVDHPTTLKHGVAVVGLGASGRLTTAELTEALIPAFIDLARRHRAPSLPLEVAVVPIGTSETGGLSVEACVRATLNAVMEAEEQLEAPTKRSGNDRRSAAAQAFSRLRFVERFADKVELLSAALTRLQVTARQSRVEFDPVPTIGEGHAPGGAPTDREDLWRRLTVRAKESAGETELTFTSVGRLAAVGWAQKKFDTDLVHDLISDAIHDANNTAVVRSLFELLVPDSLKAELSTGENLQLLVDERSAYLPWELLTPRSLGYENPLPLARRGGVLRQLEEEAERRVQRVTPTDNRALVIGNPPSGLPPLPGAATEATTVAEVLEEASWQTTTAIWDVVGRPIFPTDTVVGGGNPADLVTALTSVDWRIVHIAAHGTVGDTTPKTGVVLADRVISPNTFACLAAVPDLVFINACHLGAVGRTVDNPLGRINEMASSVARTLMQIGVRCVVVAGWAVNDAAAEIFAKTFYESMITQAETFGKAVALARAAAHELVPHAVTWGAYHCYGDAGYRLVRPKRKGDSKTVSLSEAEAVRRIDRKTSLISDAPTADDREERRNRVRAELDAFGRATDRLPPDPTGSKQPSSGTGTGGTEKPTSAPVLEALGKAYAELGEFDMAINLYQRALGHEEPLCSVKTIEQLGNLLNRSASRPRSAKDALSAEQMATLFNSSLVWIDRALALGDTGERRALRGGCLKRQAVVQGDRRVDLVREAASDYRRAWQLKESAYHICLWSQMAAIATLLGDDSVAAVADADRARAAFDDWMSKEPATDGPAGGKRRSELREGRFWDRSQLGDEALTRLVLDVTPTSERDDHAADIQRVEELYLNACTVRVSLKDAESVAGHLVDLATLLEANVDAAGASRFVPEWVPDALRGIAAAVTAAIGDGS